MTPCVYLWFYTHLSIVVIIDKHKINCWMYCLRIFESGEGVGGGTFCHLYLYLANLWVGPKFKKYF